MTKTPADIFFSADEAKMDGLVQKGLATTETRKSRLSNTLVVAVNADSTLAVNSAKEPREQDRAAFGAR